MQIPEEKLEGTHRLNPLRPFRPKRFPLSSLSELSLTALRRRVGLSFGLRLRKVMDCRGWRLTMCAEGKTEESQNVTEWKAS